MDYDEILEHFGIKGMHWGVRKASDGPTPSRAEKKLAKQDAKFEKHAVRGNRQVSNEIWNGGAHAFNTSVLPGINSKPEYKNGVAHDPKLQAKYDNEVRDALIKTMDAAALASGYVNASGTRRFTLVPVENGWSLQTKALEHADGLTITAIRSKNGLVESIDIPELVQSDQYGDMLAHFGIKGMHWGVRRKRDEQGHVEVAVSKKTGQSPSKIEVRKGAGLPASEDAIKTAVYKRVAAKSGTNALTNKELQDLVNRMNLEQQFSKLQPVPANRLKTTRSFINQTLQDARTINDINNLVRSPAGKALTSQLKKG